LQREALREKVFRYQPADLFGAVVSSLEASGRIVAQKDVLRLAEHKSELDPAEAKIADALRSIYISAGVEPPKLDDALAKAASGSPPAEVRKVFNFMLKTGEIIKISEDLYFSSDAIQKLKAAVREFADRSTDRVIDVPRFKEIAGVSRKYAIPLLEYFDRERVTVRAGDKRVVLK
jgi:selenocysteine-specific elongation factor